MPSAPTDERVIVGVEGTDAGRLAVAWAADEAVLHGRPLRLIRALDWPLGADENLAPKAPWDTWRSRYRSANRQVLDEARAAVLERHPGLDVDERLIDGLAERVLGEASGDAFLTVLGSRHLSSLREAFTTGSVAVPVIAHASCPVAVIRCVENTGAVPPTVVVGVDGSRGADLAWEHACEEAALRGASVLAIFAYTIALSMGATAMLADAALRDARETLAHSVDTWRARYPGIPIVGDVRLGHPVRVLTDASEDALLLVVGNRGIGGFRRMLLGSVSHGLVHNARCPLVVVPGGASEA
ncbi:universal stress protein [Yinghuangia sp. ASG 101]|uniref:universal stress protein n=1 Tax=Yinghuangia sp. ASG 101 TaxID=2896848 RepID=UPI001E2D6358|nr:universal stress protein [Yinghuangia sp. ASG 101]UGQ11692.1 universal stress protein [Yinghuangia sp. ASG 101]